MNITLPEYKLTPRPSLIEGVSDSMLALASPIVAYWSYSAFFAIIDAYEVAEMYRIHPPEEVASRNKASKWDVFKDVVLQHIIQTIAGYAVSFLEPEQMTGDEEYRIINMYNSFPLLPKFVHAFMFHYGFSAIRIGIAFVIIDSWQYWLHRIMHMNKTLYKHFHSRHHRLYVPYAFGALYNDPVEGFLLDTAGTGLAGLLTGLTPREQLVLYTFSTLKTVDDHCGYALPYDPFQRLFPNNSIYHDIHHQQFGIKTNFSQPFFTFWDIFQNTRYTDLDKYREEQKQVTIEKYKQFLHDREQQKKQKMNSIYGTTSVNASGNTLITKQVIEENTDESAPESTEVHSEDTAETTEDEVEEKKDK
ncbi:CYFA0S28e00452g1_1 [Cyberlindnera fabianii]|uniref:CYFA0S28e00452g1_1 n=1 Tax=Cyberlindnera fabianii TaxID=36022 RepID=A0A061BAY3_CYBFA|nr:CYFA0S28e00452g1_1 [Cyberlindnera fabianii]